MRIAIPYKDEMIFQHFGKSESFKIYDVENLEIVNSQVINNESSGHDAISGLLNDLGVHLVICGGIGEGMINCLSSYNITVISGLNIKCDDAVEAFLSGQLLTHDNLKEQITCEDDGCGCNDHSCSCDCHCH